MLAHFNLNLHEKPILGNHVMHQKFPSRILSGMPPIEGARQLDLCTRTPHMIQDGKLVREFMMHSLIFLQFSTETSKHSMMFY